MNELREDYLPGCGYKIYQDPGEFTFTTDSLFLARFPHLVTRARVLELGCGTGAVSLGLAARGAAQVTGLDINPRMAELLNRSAAANGLAWDPARDDEAETVLSETGGAGPEGNVEEEDAGGFGKGRMAAASVGPDRPSVRALVWDIKEIRRFCPTESFDLTVANPPYRNSGRERLIGTAACHEKTAVLEDFFAAAAYALRSRGRFALVQLPDRFMEAMELARRYGLQPKRLQWVHASVDKPAWIFLLEMVKGGRYGLSVLPPLIMYNKDGSLTEQATAWPEPSE